MELTGVTVLPIDRFGPLELEVESFLIRTGPGHAPFLTTDDLGGFVSEPVVGAAVDGSDFATESVALVVVAVTADNAGAWLLNGIELTYRSGIHPSRTVALGPTVCATVTNHPGLLGPAGEPPDQVEPPDWPVPTSCDDSR